MAGIKDSNYRGLRGQIKYVEETITIKKQLGKDASFEKGLVREWKRYLPSGDKHHLWVQYSSYARRQDARPTHSLDMGNAAEKQS